MVCAFSTKARCESVGVVPQPKTASTARTATERPGQKVEGFDAFVDPAPAPAQAAELWRNCVNLGQQCRTLDLARATMRQVVVGPRDLPKATDESAAPDEDDPGWIRNVDREVIARNAFPVDRVEQSCAC